MVASLPVTIGEVLVGKYRVERIIGRGGMGLVAAATHLQLHQTVALKFIAGDLLDKPYLVERFLLEARSTVRLKSHHVARVFDVAMLPDGVPFIIMEYLEGCDLATALKQDGPLSIETAAAYVLQASDAIAEAHGLGIIHRDLKPSNLFVTRSAGGTRLVKVLDFGLSKAITVGNPGVTNSGAVLGSPSYMSPEQMRDASRVNVRSDIWSLGVILYELVTGRLPFPAQGLIDVGMQVVSEPPAPLGLAEPGFEAIVLRCLEKDPAKRYASVAELAAALAPFAPADARALVADIVGMKAPARTPHPSPAPVLTDPQLPLRTTLSEGAAQSLSRPPRPRRILVVVILLGGSIVALAAAFVLFAPRSPSVVAAAASDARPVPPPAPDAPSPAPLPRTPDAPQRAMTVSLQIEVAPPGVEVFLDGQRLGTAPGVFPVAPSATPHRLELRKNGYAPWSEEVTLARDVILPVRLQRKISPPKPASPEDLPRPDWDKR
jgi:eukaryotic-like serine/threonine-protein kinase